MSSRPVLGLSLLLLMGCASDPSGRGSARPSAAPCFESEPSPYSRVSLCLDAPSGGRFTLRESRTVPGATLGSSCDGSYRREGARLVLEIEGCDRSTYDEQRHQSFKRREPQRAVQEASVRSASEVVVHTSWGEELVARLK